MMTRSIKVENRLGLHARPSALLVRAATKYRSEFFIERGGERVNGKSIMGVMMLAAEYGSELLLIANGTDEKYLLDDIVELFQSKFHED